jgi:hypothetical protein
MKRKLLLGVIASMIIGLSIFNVCSAADNKELQQIKLQQDRIMAVNEIQNLMSTYCLYHFANMYDDARYAGLFAKDPDTKIQTSRGIWVGEKAGERMLKYYLIGTGSNGFAGQMHLHPMMNSIIVVAGDGKTAKGIWVSPGAEVTAGKGMWLTVKYAVDFKKMGSEWKIWHIRTNGVYMNQIGSDTVGQSAGGPGGGGAPGGSGGAPGGGAPGGSGGAPGGSGGPGGAAANIDKSLQPDLLYQGQPMYSATTVQVLDPEPPKPYETWDDSMSYLPQK